MNDQPSFFPRLHQDDITLQAQQSIRQQIDSVPGLDALLKSFEKATGWVLSYHELTGEQSANYSSGNHSPSNHLNEIGPQPLSKLLIDDLSEQVGAEARPASRADCDEVVEAVGDIINSLHRTRRELRERSAELATAIPVVRRSGDSSIADLLESLLRSAGQLVNASAAGIYLLDDATVDLSLRVSVGLPSARLNEPSRPLAGAAGDLEALLGHAVVVKDVSAVADWNIPEEFNSAICLPIATPTVPLGTMWLFADSLREITNEDTEILEIIAGRIAAELEREAVICNATADRAELAEMEKLIDEYRPTEKDRRLMKDILGHEMDAANKNGLEVADELIAGSSIATSSSTDEADSIDSDLLIDSTASEGTIPVSQSELDRAISWQKKTEPVMMPMLDGWEIGGRCRSVQTLNSAFNGWQVLPDSRIAFFLGDSCGEGIEAALTAASLRTAIKSLSNQMLAPHIIMDRISEILWHDEMGDQFVSLFCGMIDPDSGRLEFCSAGNAGAIILDSFVDRNMLEFSEPLGTDIDARFESETHNLLPGQSLFIYNDGLRQLGPTDRYDVEDEGLSQTLNVLGGGDLGTINEWVEGRFANRSVSSCREPSDAAFTLIKRV